MFFDRTPIGVLFLATFLLICLALEAGFRLGKWRQRRAEGKAEKADGLVGATMGLVALMLAFTFNGAATRHEARKGLVVDDVNSIEQTWLRAGLLAEPERDAARAALREYVGVRVDLVHGKMGLAAALHRSEELQDRLWAVAVEAGRRDPASITTGLFIHSLNHMIDTHLKRLTVGLRHRVPHAIWAALYLLLTLAMGMLGAQMALGGARPIGIGLSLAFAFSVVLFLIADLDRPQEGLVNVDQEAMTELLRKLDAH